MAALSQILSHPWITDHATTAMVKSMFSERMDMKMEWPRQTKTETSDRDGSGYHDDHRERKESGSRGEQEAEAKEQKREKATRGE